MVEAELAIDQFQQSLHCDSPTNASEALTFVAVEHDGCLIML